MLRVLIADKFPESRLETIRSLDVELLYQPDCNKDQLGDVLSQNKTNILLVRSTKVSAQSIQKGSDLMLIVRVGAGVNTIDITEASKKGIYIANCPGKNAIAVAELAMGLILSLDRRIPQATQSLRAGLWEKKEFSKADGVKGKTLGIAGLGRIGLELAKRAKSFDLKVIAWSADLTPTKAKVLDIGYCATIQELCQRADIVSVHLPSTPQTKGLFSYELFQQMKQGAFFINTSRGELHIQADLEKAIKDKELRVGLDVYEQEPAAADKEFAASITQLQSFIGTPHIGASTRQAQFAVADEAIRIVTEFMQKGHVPNCVNLEKTSSTKSQILIRHYNKVGVLATVMDLLRQDEINIEEMNNIIFQTGQTAVASIQLNQKPSESLIKKLESKKDLILQVTVIKA